MGPWKSIIFEDVVINLIIILLYYIISYYIIWRYYFITYYIIICLLICFVWVFVRDLSRKMHRNELAPEARKQGRAPDNLDIMSKISNNIFYPFVLPVGDRCRGKIPGQNVHSICAGKAAWDFIGAA